MDPVRRSYWSTGALVALVFVLGVATGGFASRALHQRRLRELVMGDPAVMRNRLTMHALERRLELTPGQRAQAERVLDAQAAPYREALEPCREPIRELRRDMARQLGPALEPGQRAVLEELVREGERFR
jgi:hypothetical protein